jgi:hypothetical protein
MKNKCIECGIPNGGHMTGCPETPETPVDGVVESLHTKIDAMSREEAQALLKNIVDVLYPNGDDDSEWNADTVMFINDLLN